ncbi:MAG TPA: chromate resistance protein ChrB domain-containing protein [Vicinamibacterales bacterium]|nr:chromate resistance protein ChrB domain-containing protein [Vicinamibacterales bacterium]
MSAQPHPRSAPARSPDEGTRRWLLLVHQLPATPSNLRVRTWRRLQQLGAVPLRQAVYVLPDSANAREDFEWLKAEIAAAGGEASILTGTLIDAAADAELVEAFKRARQNDYTILARDLEFALKKAEGARRPRGRRAPAVRRLSKSFRQRLSSIETMDFFASAGRDRVIALIERLHAAGGGTSPRPAGGDAPQYRDRLWVTRPRPGVDRMASAWLVRRFIDPKARFAFAADRAAVPAEALPFDMFGVEFTHQGDDCTFETLCRRFGMQDPAVGRIGELVHDLDLKDGKFAAPEAAAIGAMIDGLQLTHADDHDLLERGMAMFESLYRSFERSARPARPRGVARAKRSPKRR